MTAADEPTFRRRIWSAAPWRRLGTTRLGAASRAIGSSLITHHSSLIASLFWTAVALAFLLACDLLLFRNAIVDGQIYSRSDTVTYYFPIADRLTDVLHQGRLLLWTRYLFGGFPLFADGEAGMLYPPNLLAYLLLPEQQAFIWLRVARYFMAAAFTYGYLRTLRLNRYAATVGALTFTFGSFMVTQMHHTNVGNTALWLPLTLSMVELAVRNVGRRRWIYVAAAGASTGIQALGLHIQPLIMSGLFLAAYIPFRVLLCPIAWPAPKGPKGREGACPLPPSGIPGDGSLLTSVDQQDCMGGPLCPPSGPAETPAPTSSLLSGGEDSSISGVEVLAGAADPDGASIPQRGWRDRLKGQLLWLKSAREGLSVRTGLRGQQSLRDRPGPRLTGRLLGPAARRIASFLAGSFHRTALTLLILGAIPAIAFGIAAAQVIPLVELGMYSFRGPGVTYQFATSYSMPVQNLVNLIFPYFFRYTSFFYWSLWSEWETTLYAGIGGLVLASVAVIFVRNRMVLFFAMAATLSVFLAFGSYSPYPLYEKVWTLPGFSSLRVPGRFGMLVTFSIAVLAAYGIDWLCRTLRPTEVASLRGRWRHFSRAAGVHGFAIYLMALLSAVAGVVWWLVGFRIWIEREPWAVKRLVEQSYLSLRSDRPWLTSDMVISFLNYSLDPTNSKTATSLALMLAVFLLLFAWFAFRRLWRVWATLMVGLVAADLMLFALDFHPTVSIDQLTTPNSATRWLMAQDSDGMTRVYSPREVRKTEPNKLLPFQVSDIAGYSSLETERHQQFMVKLNEFDKPLLDLSNVRFVILPKRPTALPSYEYTSYHPNHPLADGPRTNPGAQVTFYMNPPVKADEVAFISNLRSADSIPQDAEVADIVVVDTQGERTTLKVRAGRDTGEWAWDRPDVTPHVAHQRPRVADKVWVQDPNGLRFQANLYYARLPLDKTRTVARVEFHYTYPKGSVRLYGMMLWEKPGTAHQVLASNRFIPRYEDDEIQILENPSRLPRAYLVPTARIVDRRQILDTMAKGDFDPTKVVLLENSNRVSSIPLPVPDTGVPDPQAVESWLQGNPDSSPGSAEITDYQSTEVEIRTSSSRNALLFLADSYYPGWKVLVDGKPSTVYRADYIFRAVMVPQGEHRVQFLFQPESFALGADISTFTVSGLLVFWAVMLAGVPLGRRGWRRVRGRTPTPASRRRGHARGRVHGGEIGA